MSVPTIPTMQATNCAWSQAHECSREQNCTGNVQRWNARCCHHSSCSFALQSHGALLNLHSSSVSGLQVASEILSKLLSLSELLIQVCLQFTSHTCDPSLIQQKDNQLLHHNCIYINFSNCFEVSLALLF